MIHDEGLPAYSAIPGAGRLIGEPPFTFSGVVLRIFPIQANAQVLQRFVHRCLNVMPEEIAFYRLALPYVYIHMVSYEQMSVDSVQGAWVSQCEITFSVALEQYRRARGRLTFENWTWFTPYIVVDQAPPQMTGREVYGWPKEVGRLGQREGYWERHPRTPRSLFRLSARAVTWSDGRPQFRHQPLLDVDQLPPTSFLQFRPREEEMLQVPARAARSVVGALARSIDLGAFLVETWGAGAIGMELDGAIPPSFPPAALFRDLLKRPRNSTTTLKQFRDEVYPQEICYQAIVEAPLGLKRFRNVGLLGEANVLAGDSSGGYVVRVFDDITHPIAANMGLIPGEVSASPKYGRGRYVDLTPILPFWVEADLTHGKGKVIGWRDQRNEWRTVRGGKTWVFRNHDPLARPPFNAALGGAPERLLSRLRPRPQDNVVEPKPWQDAPADPSRGRDPEAARAWAPAAGAGDAKRYETPDLRLQRATYLVFGFKADQRVLAETCRRYLCPDGTADECPYEPKTFPGESFFGGTLPSGDWTRDHGSAPQRGSDAPQEAATEGDRSGRQGCVYLLFGVVEQFGGRPTLGGESWRVFDVQLGFAVQRRVAAQSIEGDDQKLDEPSDILLTVPYHFMDQPLGSVVAREFWGWPVVPAEIRVSGTAWLDTFVSPYAARYKEKQDENEFFEVVVHASEGQSAKVLELVLLRREARDSPQAVAIRKRADAIEELKRLVQALREQTLAAGNAFKASDFTAAVRRLFALFASKPTSLQVAEEIDEVTTTLLAHQDPSDELLRSVISDLKLSGEQLDHAVRTIDIDLWGRHPASWLAATFMNGEKVGKDTVRPVRIQRIGLKQFRDADQPTRACFQSLVRTPIELDDWSETRQEFRRRPYFAWFRPGRHRQAVIRFNHEGWGGELVATMGLASDFNRKEEDLGYTEPEQWFNPFFMSGQLKIYRSRRLRWRTGHDWQEEVPR
jgi:hypothetical protein